jgi:hypothetical protein
MIKLEKVFYFNYLNFFQWKNMLEVLEYFFVKKIKLAYYMVWVSDLVILKKNQFYYLYK